MRPVTTQLVAAAASPAVRSAVNVITSPATDATRRSVALGVIVHVWPVASLICTFMPAAMVTFASATLITLGAVVMSTDTTAASARFSHAVSLLAVKSAVQVSAVTVVKVPHGLDAGRQASIAELIPQASATAVTPAGGMSVQQAGQKPV